jgi:hypothetical protein
MDSKMMTGGLALFCGSVALLVWATLCVAPASKPAAVHAEAVHDHHSSHGGVIEVAGDHHLEAAIEKGGKLRVYILGKDESELVPISTSALSAEVQTEKEMEARRVQLRAQPQSGEPAGKSSRFVGTLPPSLGERPLTLTVNVPLDEKQYRVRFELKPHTAEEDSHAETAMPTGVGDGGESAERELYFTPKGRYTLADIRANGAQLPSEKFKGLFASHNMHPRTGDRLCPITRTLANQKFTWIVGGKKYLFCCPPCVDEFVRMSRENPESIQPPEAYVKR